MGSFRFLSKGEERNRGQWRFNLYIVTFQKGYYRFQEQALILPAAEVFESDLSCCLPWYGQLMPGWVIGGSEALAGERYLLLHIRKQKEKKGQTAYTRPFPIGRPHFLRIQVLRGVGNTKHISDPLRCYPQHNRNDNQQSSMELSAPMEVSVQHQIANDVEISEENGVAQSSSPLPILAPDKFPVSVEVCLKPHSTARPDDVRSAVEQMLEKRSLSYVDGPIPVPVDDPFLMENVQTICICDTDEWVENHDILLFWQVKPVVHVFQLSDEGPCEELNGDGQMSSFNEWILPAKEFDGMWDSLIYESGLKQRLLRYAASALLFTEKGVNPFLVSWNRIILLHGPPGTGKTSLCKALAQKLSIRFSSRYSQCQLVEVNAHSLFSKWFSESGKLVAKLFQKIQEMVEEENNLVFVLIDEVESLAAARKAALSGSEPSDSIRVVNALLTQMDKLKSSPNVMILTTSNITSAIDVAFVDRADIKAYVGPPTVQARYEILRSCMQELMRTEIISSFQDFGHALLPNYATLKERQNRLDIQENQTLQLGKQLLEAADACEGLSGRSLRKLPFLAHAALSNPYGCDPSTFLCTIVDTARKQRSELPD